MMTLNIIQVYFIEAFSFDFKISIFSFRKILFNIFSICEFLEMICLNNLKLSKGGFYVNSQ